MYEYRKKASTNNSEEESLIQHSPASQGEMQMGTKPGYLILAAKYGATYDMDIGKSDENEQTVEEEYQAYVTAQVLRMDTLRFWEVGDINNTNT